MLTSTESYMRFIAGKITVQHYNSTTSCYLRDQRHTAQKENCAHDNEHFEAMQQSQPGPSGSNTT